MRLRGFFVLLALAVLLIPAIALGNHGNPGEHVANAIAILDGINANKTVETQIAAARAELVQAQNDLLPPPTTPPPTTPPPPGDCIGVQVPAGADIQTIVPNGVAETYCLAAGTYELGATSLGFDSGDAIIGPPVTFGPKGEVTAQAFIHGSSTTGVIAAGSLGGLTLTLENLDISGAGGGQNGAGWTDRADGVSGNYGKIIYLTVRNSRIHDNASGGIAHIGRGLIVENSEIDHNGATHGGYDAGIKTVHYAVVNNTYFHHNFNGLWWDCDAPGGEVTNSLFESQIRAGVFVEISSADSPRPVDPGQTRGFRILTNRFEGNNTSNTAPYGGILIGASTDVMVDGNVSVNNTWQEIRVQNDTRSGQGHNGCSSGFFVANDTVQNNQYGPIELQGCSLEGVSCVNNTKIL